MKSRKGLSIRHKIFGGMILISVIPIILFAYFSIKITYTALHSQLVDSRTVVMSWLNDRLTLTASSYADQFYGYEVDKNIKSALVSWGNGDSLNYIEQDSIRNRFETTLNLDSNIISIEVYNLKTGEGYLSTRSSFQKNSRDPSQNIWGNRSAGLQNNVVFKMDKGNLVVMHQVNDFNTGKGVAVILFRLSNYVFSDILDQVQSNKEENALLLNDSNQIILSITDADSDFTSHVMPGLIEETQKTKSGLLYDNNHYYFYQSVLSGKLQVLYIVPNDTLAKTVRQTTTLCIILVLLSIAAALFLSVILSQVISKPIISLSKKMRTTNFQNFQEADEPEERHDEIGYLQRSFGIMIRRNQELIAKEYQSELEKRNAQINALQAQINPHFMYNTLQVIGGMSMKGKMNDIYPMVTALSDIMRYSFNFSREMVPLQKETEYLLDYLTIQNQRFNNRITFTAEITDELMKAYIPKLILQPILENSFEHGLTQKEGKWIVCLKATADPEFESLIISISDNGLGITPERLDEIREKLDAANVNVMAESSHIGLVNVHARIRLRFGGDYGVHVASEEGKGTLVTITTKLIWEADA